MIRVEHLFYTYPKAASPVLKDLNFEIKAGEIFGFLGPSGAGKSTTQKILYKILTGFKGTVSIQEKPIQAWGKAYFSKIGVGFELPNHYLQLSGRENLELFASFYSKDRILKLEDLFGLVGLSEAMNQRVASYSKGMKVRLNFIRAVMHQPDILFFDEPTAGLDPVNAHKIKKLIQNLKNRGNTIFITTHDMATADDLCDRVAFIVDGEIVRIDSPRVLKQQYGQRRVLVELSNQETAEFALEKLGHQPEFLHFIQKDEVARIHTLEATLEEVFIEVTGTSLQV